MLSRCSSSIIPRRIFTISSLAYIMIVLQAEIILLVGNKVDFWKEVFNMMWGGPWGGWGHMFGFGGVMMLFVILFWALVIVGIVYAIRAIGSGSTRSDSGGNRALEILKERYAKGELDTQEYEERKRTLMG